MSYMAASLTQQDRLWEATEAHFLSIVVDRILFSAAAIIEGQEKYQRITTGW